MYMPRSYYLPEHHAFEYIAAAPWPIMTAQMDWIEGYSIMESWLEQYVGEHLKRWAWTTTREHTSAEACVAFKWDKHRTLFLLTWS